MPPSEETTSLLGVPQVETSSPSLRRRYLLGTIAVVVVTTIVALGCGLVKGSAHSQFVASVISTLKNEADLKKHDLVKGCSFRIVESIPEGLTYNSTVDNMRTFEAWNTLLNLTETHLELASSYWTLRGSDFYSDRSDWQGEKIFQRIEAAAKSGLKISIAQNQPDPRFPNLDTDYLAKTYSGNVQVKSLNFTHLMGAGILHTKLWVADRKHFYVGSANFDWRSLTQVKEMGVLVTDCPVLAQDMGKIFDVYWALGGKDKTVPKTWPSSLSTDITADSPLPFQNSVDGKKFDAFLSSSPEPFCPEGRDRDLNSILRAIAAAAKFVHVAVMDYFPETIYGRPPHFWPIIDDALRKAAIERHIEVRLLLSHWDHTRADMQNYLSSLTALNGTQKGQVRVEGKLFQVPATPAQAKIPFARVNHNKYLVTDKTGFIGTSNWSADYFLSTGGIGFVWNQCEGDQGLRKALEAVFNRDWESDYARAV